MSEASRFSVGKGLLIIVILVLSALYGATFFQPAQAGPTFNVITNPSFENGVSPVTGYPVNWGNWTKHSCAPYQNCVKTAEIGVDSLRSITGNYSVRITLGQLSIGFAAIYQNFPLNTRFRNLTDSIGNVDLWFYLEPKYSGLSDFAVKVYAQNAMEIDYVFDPDPRLSYPNQTFLDGRPFVKSFLFGDLTGTSPQYPAGQWHHFNFRNLKADWDTPMRYYNSTCSPCLLPGFGLNQTLARIELLILSFQDTSTGSYYAATAWADEVNVILDPPTRFHSVNFTFTDLENNTIDNVVKWRLLDQTGSEIPGYTPGDPALEEGNYTIEVYYPVITTTPSEQFLIHRRILPLDPPSPTTIRLPMVNELTGQSDYIAFNNTITSGTLTLQNSDRISFTASGSGGPYKVLLRVPSVPTAVVRSSPQTELLEGADWTFNSTYSILSIETQTLGAFAAYFVPVPRIPTISFIDRTGHSASAAVTVRILNSQNSIIAYVPGSLPTDQNFPYTLEAEYLGNLIYRNAFNLTVDPQISVTLQMLRISDTPGYIAVNSTVNSITLTEGSESKLKFTIDGSGPSSIIVKVPKRPLYVERDGVRITNWTYEGNTGTAVIETSSLGTFSVVFEASPNQSSNLYNIIYAALGALLTALVILTVVMVRRRRTPKP